MIKVVASRLECAFLSIATKYVVLMDVVYGFVTPISIDLFNLAHCNVRLPRHCSLSDRLRSLIKQQSL